MASDDVVSRPSHFMIIPNTKRHPNNTKTEQLPISEVITGLPRPYHHTDKKSSPWTSFPVSYWVSGILYFSDYVRNLDEVISSTVSNAAFFYWSDLQ